MTRRATAGALFVGILGALTMLPPLATDVALPGLPTIARALRASDTTMQLTLSVFIFAFGIGQLVLGPLSDRYGRRPLLFLGLGAFTLAGIGCAVATDGTALVVLRFVQGFGACAGTVCGRAIVQDVARGDTGRAASLQGYLSAINSLAPVVAPLLGAGILLALDWRWLYGLLPVVGVFLLASVAVRIPETSPRAAHGFLTAYRRVVRLPRTLPLACVTFGAFGGYFTLIASSPFVLVTQLHVPSAVFAALFALNAIALLAGATLTGRFAARIGTERLFGYGVCGMVAAGVCVLAADGLAPSPAGFAATMMLFAFTFGIVMPSAFAAALADAGVSAGLTAGVLGAAQMAGGAAMSAAAAALPTRVPSSATGIGVVAGAALVGAGYLASRARHANAGVGTDSGVA